MKMLKALLLSAAVLALSAAAKAQTSIDIATNLPAAQLGSEKFGLATGLVQKNGTSENVICADWNVSGTFFLRAEIQNATTTSSAIDYAGVGGGVYRSLSATSRAYGFMEGGRNWNSRKWEGRAGLGIAYTPSAAGILQHFSLFYEPTLVVTASKTQPGIENRAGIRYSF